MIYKDIYEAVLDFKRGIKDYPKIGLLDKNGKINEVAIKTALKAAFRDITPRTMTRTGDDLIKFDKLSENLYKYTKQGSKETFGELIKIWFETSTNDIEREKFDAVHSSACDTIITFLKENGYSEDSATYGKAQKVVNMTFKHLYCLALNENDRTFELDSHFNFCHMALDSFTLEWLKRTKDSIGYKITKGHVASWSSIEEHKADEYEKKVSKNKDETQSFYSYHKLVNMIRDIIPKKDYRELTPFKAEFFIWPEIQLHLAAESLFGQSIGQTDTFGILEAHLKAHGLGEEKLHKDFIEARKNLSQTDISKKANASFKILQLEAKMEIVKEKVTCILAYYNKTTSPKEQ